MLYNGIPLQQTLLADPTHRSCVAADMCPDNLPDCCKRTEDFIELHADREIDLSGLWLSDRLVSGGSNVVLKTFRLLKPGRRLSPSPPPRRAVCHEMLDKNGGFPPNGAVLEGESRWYLTISIGVLVVALVYPCSPSSLLNSFKQKPRASLVDLQVILRNPVRWSRSRIHPSHSSILQTYITPRSLCDLVSREECKTKLRVTVGHEPFSSSEMRSIR